MLCLASPESVDAMNKSITEFYGFGNLYYLTLMGPDRFYGSLIASFHAQCKREGVA
jgi:hypothetical protein